MKRIAALVGVMTLTVGAWSALAQAESVLMVTGGGQILNEDQTTGAGDTIAFTARQTDADEFLGQGQVQYVDRNADGGKPVVLHGIVDCVMGVATEDEDDEYEDEQGAAIISGTFKDEDETPFQIFVQDNGEPNQGQDLIAIDYGSDTPPCDDQETDEARNDLARGNAQIHNYEDQS